MSYSYEVSLEITQVRRGPEKRTLLYGTLLLWDSSPKYRVST